VGGAALLAAAAGLFLTAPLPRGPVLASVPHRSLAAGHLPALALAGLAVWLALPVVWAVGRRPGQGRRVLPMALLLAATAVYLLADPGPRRPILVSFSHHHGIDPGDLFALAPVAAAAALVWPELRAVGRFLLRR